MATFSRFEDIPIWQSARELSKKIFAITRQSGFSKDYRFSSQITAAAGSIMDNIAEGFEREGIKEFIQFLFIAKGSCGEVRSQLYRAYDAEYIKEETLKELLQDNKKLSTDIHSFINYLKTSEVKGTKYKKSPLEN